MKIRFHSKFVKNYQRRIRSNKNLVIQVEERIEIFKNNPNDPVLKNHILKGSKSGYKSFSITGDIRIIYEQISSDEIVFLDIGSHNQVY